MSVSAEEVRPHEKFEVTFDVPGTWSNPFDPDEIAADQFYGRLAAVGGNFARSWWCAGGTDLESLASAPPGHGPGRYKLDEAWRIDHLVNLAERLGIRLMCCLETQQYLRRDAWWAQFSHNVANGGSVTTPADFFVNPRADAFFRKRLRYIVARWAYSPAVFSWHRKPYLLTEYGVGHRGGWVKVDPSGAGTGERGHLKPAGQWNSQEIMFHGRRAKITLNGVVIVEVDLDNLEYKKYLDRNTGRARAKGHIGFLGHGSPVEFRNIRIKEL